MRKSGKSRFFKSRKNRESLKTDKKAKSGRASPNRETTLFETLLSSDPWLVRYRSRLRIAGAQQSRTITDISIARDRAETAVLWCPIPNRSLSISCFRLLSDRLERLYLNIATDCAIRACAITIAIATSMSLRHDNNNSAKNVSQKIPHLNCYRSSAEKQHLGTIFPSSPPIPPPHPKHIFIFVIVSPSLNLPLKGHQTQRLKGNGHQEYLNLTLPEDPCCEDTCNFQWQGGWRELTQRWSTIELRRAKLPIASVQRTQSTLVSHSAIPHATNVTTPK